MRDPIDLLLDRLPPTLSASDERELFTALREKMAIVAKVDAMKKPGHAWCTRRGMARRSVQQLRTKLVDANIPLVVTTAKKRQYRNVAFDELVSEGTLVLLRCIDRFDPSRGFKFSTYACRSLFNAFGSLAHKESKHHQKRLNVDADPGGYEEADSPADHVREVIELVLQPDEAVVLRLRRGIGHEKAYNMVDTAEKLGLSKRKTIRLYDSAMKKVEEGLRTRGFTV